MTAIELLHGFVNALNDRIEGAVVVVDDYAAFEAASKDIEILIRTELPFVKEAFEETGLDADARKHLETCLKGLSDLETQARARSVWARDFSEYMREALSKND
ncbi:MAG: hypothetical protein VXW18_08800 [Pseudomonadota bacterium]|nr:hypothetical protein [Pseudomonadota bacterium]